MLACTCMYAYEHNMWEYACLTVDITITIIFIIPSSSLDLLILPDCCVSLD